jgi:hypothetical protein
MKKLILVAAGLSLAWPLSVVAHHSFAAEFDAKQPTTLTGKLTKMEWVNPHVWLHIDVTQPDGKVVNWAIEANGPNALMRQGLRQSDFPLAAEIVVEGYRAKNGSPTASGTTVKFADGRNFFLGAAAGTPGQAPR